MWWSKKPSAEEERQAELNAIKQSGLYKKAQAELQRKAQEVVIQLTKIYKPEKAPLVSYLGSKVYVTGVDCEIKGNGLVPIVILTWFDGFKHVQNAEVTAVSVDTLKALVIPPVQVFGKYPESCDPLEEGTAV